MIQKPNIHIIATGGTIAGQAGSATATTGYQAGALTVGQLLASVPGLDRLANFTGEQFSNIDSKDMTESMWLRLAHRVNEVLRQDAVDGVVITHGTDTMEETAFFLQLTVETAKPVVLTGAMRPATALSADGPMNIWQAVRVAGDKTSRGRGVLVVMNGQIDTAWEVTKTNSYILQTFQSNNYGPAGVLVGEQIYWKSSATPNMQAVSHNETGQGKQKMFFFDVENISQLPKVRILYSCVGDDGFLINAARQNGAQGLVFAACGNGSIPESLEGILQNTVQAGVPVVVSSRCSGGVVILPEEIKEKAHIIGSGPLNAQKAKILLQLALTKSNDTREIETFFK